MIRTLLYNVLTQKIVYKKSEMNSWPQMLKNIHIYPTAHPERRADRQTKCSLTHSLTRRRRFKYVLTLFHSNYTI